MKCQAITLALLATLTSLASGALLCRDGLNERCVGNSNPITRTCNDADDRPNNALTSGACLGYSFTNPYPKCTVDQPTGGVWKCNCPDGIPLFAFKDHCKYAGGFTVSSS